MTKKPNPLPVGTAAIKLRDAMDRFQSAGDDAGAKARFAREIYSALRDACDAYCRPENHPPGSRPRENFPAEVAFRISMLLGTQLAGRPTPSFEALLSGNGQTFTPVEARAIQAACRYGHAVKSGLIKDKSYRKTIGTWFGVSAWTVTDWMRFPHEPIAEFLPDGGDVQRAELIISLAQKQGALYSRIGSGREAIKARNAKAAPKKNRR